MLAIVIFKSAVLFVAAIERPKNKKQTAHLGNASQQREASQVNDPLLQV